MKLVRVEREERVIFTFSRTKPNQCHRHKSPLRVGSRSVRASCRTSVDPTFQKQHGVASVSLSASSRASQRRCKVRSIPRASLCRMFVQLLLETAKGGVDSHGDSLRECYRETLWSYRHLEGSKQCLPIPFAAPTKDLGGCRENRTAPQYDLEGRCRSFTGGSDQFSGKPVDRQRAEDGGRSQQVNECIALISLDRVEDSPSEDVLKASDHQQIVSIVTEVAVAVTQIDKQIHSNASPDQQTFISLCPGLIPLYCHASR
jgi:hypothetical protein